MAKEFDVCNVIDDFLNMGLVIEDLNIEYKSFQNERKVTDKRLYMHTNTEKELRNENHSLQSIITKYQEMLQAYDKVQEEKCSLKKSIDELNDQKEKLQKKIEELNEDSKCKLDHERSKYIQQLQHVQKTSEEKLSSEKHEHETRLSDVTENMKKLSNEFEQNEQQHTIELNRLQLEYETKLQKMRQRQTAQANSTSNSLITKNDIFRKKLQHLQVESEREIKQLNVRCTEQQHKITELHHQMKLLNKQSNETRKHQTEEVRQYEKLNRQAQFEIRKLQNNLKQEQDRSLTLEKTLQEKNSFSTSEMSEKSTNKKRKSMFNPQTNRLNSL